MEIGLNQIGLNMSTLESRAADFAERQLALSGAAGSDMQNYGDWSPSLGMLADTIDMNISSPDLDPMGNPLYENIIFDSPNYQALPQQYSTNMPLMDAPPNTMYNMPSSIFKTQSGPMKIGGQNFVAPTTTDPLENIEEDLISTIDNNILKNLIDFFQGQIKSKNISVSVPNRRLSLDVPLLNLGGGLISGQGSYSPYGNNYLGFKYNKSW